MGLNNNRLKKFVQIEVTCTLSFVGAATPVLEILLLFVFLQIFLLKHGLYFYGVQKQINSKNSCK